jgi:ADP-heptose:LPS heptosyltransferase
MFRPDPGVRRIAVLRANAIGDFVFTLPALEALRAAYPEAEVTLLGARWHAAFLAGRRSPVDRVVVTPPTHGVNEQDGEPVGDAERAAFFAEMARERFDLALQLHGGGANSNPFVLRLGARMTAGCVAEGAPELDRWVRYVYWQGEVARYLELVGLVGAPPVTLEPRLAVTDPDLAEAARAVADNRLVVLHPGATDPRRRWPPASFAAVGDALADLGHRVAVTGTPSEAGVVAAVGGTMRHDALDLCGRLSLGGLVGLLRRAVLVVSNDSGPLHLAGAVGTPTVGIYWGGNLVNGAPPFRARHRPLPSFRTACPACGADCTAEGCEHDDSFVADVRVEGVLDAARDLLGLGALEVAA